MDVCFCFFVVVFLYIYFVSSFYLLFSFIAVPFCCLLLCLFSLVIIFRLHFNTFILYIN